MAFRGPKAVVCWICGRQFGTRSIEIHAKSCAKMWVKREALKPRSERRPVPERPQVLEDTKGMSADEVREAQNAAAFEQFNTKAMASCTNCGRTFLPDRLVIHQRSCRPGNTARRVGQVGFGGAGAPKHPMRGGGGLEDDGSDATTIRPRTSSGRSAPGEYESVLGGTGSDYPQRPSTTLPGRRRGKTPRRRPLDAGTGDLDATSFTPDRTGTGTGASPGQSPSRKPRRPSRRKSEGAALARAADLAPATGGASADPSTVRAIEARLATMERLMRQLGDEVVQTRSLLAGLKRNDFPPVQSRSSPAPAAATPTPPPAELVTVEAELADTHEF